MNIIAYKLVDNIPVQIYQVRTTIPEVHLSRLQRIANALKVPLRIEQDEHIWIMPPHHALCCEGGEQ